MIRRFGQTLKFSLLICFVFLAFICTSNTYAQQQVKMKLPSSEIYAGIEVGSKGVKMSLLEIAHKSKSTEIVRIVKDTSSNTDFISFTPESFSATLRALVGLIQFAQKEYQIAPTKIYTVISSGVKMQADKEKKADWVSQLIDSFKVSIADPKRIVDIVDIKEEARLSHLGIVPESRRYNTFLIDIGSGNTKGGYFPNGNTQELKLFQLNWGTKSVFNTVDKRCEDDKSLSNFNKQLYRVISGTAAPEIEYAVNESGAYNMNDHIAFSGGIAWSVATLISPELIANPVVPVTFQELQKFNDQLFTSFNKMTPAQMLAKAEMGADEKLLAEKEINRVLKVFDQKSLMAGTALLLKIMRQFEGIYDKKQFYLVKNGQVGWISAYVNQQVK